MRIRILKQKPNSWAEWDEELARELEKPLSISLYIGASTAQEEIKGRLVDWSIFDPQPQQFLREHALELAKKINADTKKKITDALLTGMKLGENKNELIKRVRAVMDMNQQWKAPMIAHTEVSNAFSEGSLQLYREGNIPRKQWLASADACPACDALNETIIGIDEYFDGGEFGMVQRPALHPNCKCGIAGVAEGVKE